MKYVTSIERMGIQPGLQQGSADILLRQLQNRFGALDEAAKTHVRALPLTELETLSDELFSFATRDEFGVWLQQHPLPATLPVAFTEVQQAVAAGR